MKAFSINVADAASQDELQREKPRTSPPPITAVFFRKSRRLRLILMISLIPFLLPSSSLQPYEWLCGSADSPSMVVIFFSATDDTGVTQERIASPSTCTVQAPHSALPHPYFVPVSPIVSLITQSNGVSGVTST